MRRHRSNSRDRSITRKKSTSCKKGFLTSVELEAQSGIVNAVSGLTSLPDSLDGLMSAVGLLGEEASQFNNTLEGLTTLIGKYDPKDITGIKDGINATNSTIKEDFLPALEELNRLMSVFEKRTRPSTLKEAVSGMLPSKETVSSIITVALTLSPSMPCTREISKCRP